MLCELVWVLSGAYGHTREEIADVLGRILSVAQFDIADKDTVRSALDAYRHGPGDFADYLIGLTHAGAGCEATVTFDRRLRGHATFCGVP